MDSAFVEHTQNNITRHVTTIHTVIIVAYLPKVKNILALPRGQNYYLRLKTGDQNIDCQSKQTETNI